MGRLMILNGSPRAPRSNSRRYAQLFCDNCPMETMYADITRTNHQTLCAQIDRFSHVLLVFPLYADGIPVTLLNFLKFLETHPPHSRPTMSVLVNCGFLEARQNDVAVRMVELFCRQNRYPLGSVLKIGSGEAILDSPFRVLAARKIRRFAKSVVRGEQRTFEVTMPLPKRLFLAASTSYWIDYGKKNGITETQMRTMRIE